MGTCSLSGQHGELMNRAALRRFWESSEWSCLQWALRRAGSDPERCLPLPLDPEPAQASAAQPAFAVPGGRPDRSQSV